MYTRCCDFISAGCWYSVTVKPEYQWIGKHTVLVPSSSGLGCIRIDRCANPPAEIPLRLVIHFPRITPAERPLFDANSAAGIFLSFTGRTRCTRMLRPLAATMKPASVT